MKTLRYIKKIKGKIQVPKNPEAEFKEFKPRH